MKIGLVGYQGCGKSTLFEWLTGVAPDPALAHSGQSAMAPIPDARIEALAAIYHPKKTTIAGIEIVDTPGLSRGQEGNAARLAVIREASCLVFVVPAFGGADPEVELRAFEEDLMLADMEIVSGRMARIEEAVAKPIPRQERDQLVHERRTLEKVNAGLEAGRPLREKEMTDEELRVTRSFRLLEEKPRLVVVNTADDEPNPDQYAERLGGEKPVFAVPAGLELELARMSPEDRTEFEREMGIGCADRDALIRQMLETAGYITFFTAGDKEVRTWLLRKGGTALEAADGIHSDLARGFIRAEVFKIDDLLRLGSEREAKAQHLFRQEPKDYVVDDDDVLLIRFSV